MNEPAPAGSPAHGCDATGRRGPDAAPARRDFDVVIVGYGPVGRLLALKLGRGGHQVLVVERQTATYPLPRAVHMDDETARILQSVGAGPAQMPHIIEPYNDFYEWRSADYTPLLRLNWSGRGPSGWNVSNFFHQPAMEAALDEQVEALDAVTVLRGWRAITHLERADTVQVELQTAADDRVAVTGRYIVGADGANSMVRSWVGAAMTDLGYFHDWLVIDLLPHEPMKVEPPAWQLCDPARPTTLVPGGPGRRRFEFMRLPHETVEQLNDETVAWALLAPWDVTPDTAVLERHTVYTFQARWCDWWRRGRLLLAGDSAHLMPPFAGQGMCSGLRDAANLEWKLDLVLRGLADDSLLDTYGSERAEHVRAFIDASMDLGRIICVTDPDKVAVRDATMSAEVADGIQPPPRPLPTLGPGFHTGPHGGTLAIQAPVESSTGQGLFDDVTAGGGVLLLRDQATAGGLSASERAALTAAGIATVIFADQPGDEAVVDVTGDYRAWFDALGAAAVLMRPDFYIYGTAADACELTGLIKAFVARLLQHDHV